MSMPLVFWSMVILFAAVGSLRGWAKELLIGFAMILALFINSLLDKYAQNILQTLPAVQLLGVRAGIFLVLAYFAYLTPRLPWIPENRFVRERLQDWLLGLLIGAFNGALLAGSLWFFLHKAGYPIPGMEPAQAAASSVEVTGMISVMPPALLTELWIYIAVAVAFVFVIVVFV